MSRPPVKVFSLLVSLKHDVGEKKTTKFEIFRQNIIRR